MKTSGYPPLLAVILATFLWFFTVPESLANLDHQHSTRLETLRTELINLAQQIRSTQATRESLGSELEMIEKELTDLELQRRGLAAELDHSLEKKARLAEQRDYLLARLPEARRQLEKLARTRHRLSSKNKLQIVLDLDHPGELQRTLKYFDYLAETSANDLKWLSSEIRSLTHVQTEYDQQQEALLELEQRFTQQQQEYHLKQQHRRRHIKRLTDELQLKRRRLVENKVERQQLERLLQGIDEVKKQVSINEPGYTQPTTLSTARQTLPLSGTVIRNFRQRDHDSGIRATGVLISARGGADVRSIFEGRVVFSDWFRGFGLLLVVDHGNGIMSLYGHLSELLYKVGDKVRRGTRIARVGNTGGLSSTALYFEVRKQGNPVNPLRYIQKQTG